MCQITNLQEVYENLYRKLFFERQQCLMMTTMISYEILISSVFRKENSTFENFSKFCLQRIYRFYDSGNLKNIILKNLCLCVRDTKTCEGSISKIF